MFKLISKLIEENYRIKKRELELKYYLEFLKKSNEALKFKIDNIKNPVRTCKTCDYMKKEVTHLHESLSKFSKVKEKIDLILSSQMASLNKTGLWFKYDRLHSKKIK